MQEWSMMVHFFAFLAFEAATVRRLKLEKTDAMRYLRVRRIVTELACVCVPTGKTVGTAHSTKLSS